MSKPDARVTAVGPERLDSRVDYCWRLLWIHGFLTDSERAKVVRRARKWEATHLTAEPKGAARA